MRLFGIWILCEIGLFLLVCVFRAMQTLHQPTTERDGQIIRSYWFAYSIICTLIGVGIKLAFFL